MSTYSFFWIASDEYILEARQSARSVRNHHPDADLVLFTNDDKNIVNGIFDHVNHTITPDGDPWFLQSIAIMDTAFWHYSSGDKVVYLDTDTHVCAPLDGIFDALNRFDFVGAHAPGRQTAPTIASIPDAFPEYNIGVNGFLVSSGMRAFFGNLYSDYKQNAHIYRNNDQAPLREAIWNYHGLLRFGTLPTEYNFRFNMGGQVREMVRVLHGRSKDYEALAEIVNADVRKIRAWKFGELI